ncbi:MAG: hypothetical protein DBW85_02285 [Synechococcus sp. MED-G71]|nr:MAG: hypothetical protein DBW85_02285 [Synechococcus sp. MED-G71]|tara:strand:- start:159 stop:530 length:372 start_codon:yes stop_codon:yes gene_type:complete
MENVLLSREVINPMAQAGYNMWSEAPQQMVQLITTGLLLLSMSPAAAQPAVMPGDTFNGCRWLVPAGQSLFQPRKLEPQDVAAKNARGCLSQLDAIYGADGCPKRFCSYDEIGPLPEQNSLIP